MTPEAIAVLLLGIIRLSGFTLYLALLLLLRRLRERGRRRSQPRRDSSRDDGP